MLAEAGPVARRFLRTFARYEVGRLGGEVRVGLRATATAAFFEELVSQPPRLPSGARPERARVARGFQLLPVGRSPGRELIEVELVGTLVRAGERTPIGVRMRREEGRWRVAGLTQ